MDKLSSIIELLKKYSKLSDQQYKQILNDSNKLKLLDEKNLLDDFYKARPDKSYEELLNDYEYVKMISNKKVEIKNPIVLDFIKDFGNESIDIDILNQLKNYINKSEDMIPEGFYSLLDKMRSLKLKDIVYLYSKEKNSNNSKDLLEFIDAYKDLDEFLVNIRSKDLNEGNLQLNLDGYKRYFLDRAYNLFLQLYLLSNVDLEKKPIHELSLSKIEESLEIRDSDIFDFIL